MFIKLFMVVIDTLDETWRQCYNTNTAVIYCHFGLNYHSNVYKIDFTKER